VGKELGLSDGTLRAAVASMLVESRGNPHAVGDRGTSFGLFQLHRGGELTAAHLTPQQAFDRETNARVALRYFKEQEDAGMSNGSLAAAAQRPQNRREYAHKVNATLATADKLIGEYGNGSSDPQSPMDSSRRSDSDMGRDPDGPRGETIPGDTKGSSSIAAVMERARATGKPLSIVQIGDSHIAAGTETPEIAARLGSSDQIHNGVVGARATDALKDPNTFMRGLNSGTDLVIVSFGSNDADHHYSSVSSQQYKDSYERMLAEVHRRAPNAAVLMVGPTDGALSGRPNTRLPGLDDVIAAQRDVASQTPYAEFFDIRARLGSMQAMRGMAADRLHFTSSGYRIIGDAIAERILQGA